MNVSKYKAAPYLVQFLKLNDYVRVFNSEPYYKHEGEYDIFVGPACGFKPIMIASQIKFKKMILFDISKTQLEFYKLFTKYYNGSNMRGLITLFKRRYKHSIFKSDINNLNLSFYDERLRTTIDTWFKTRKNLFTALKRFENVEKEFIHLDLVKNFKTLKIEHKKIYFWVSNIFDFDIYKKITNINLDKALLSFANQYKNKEIVFDIQHKEHNGIFTLKELNTNLHGDAY